MFPWDKCWKINIFFVSRRISGLPQSCDEKHNTWDWGLPDPIQLQQGAPSLTSHPSTASGGLRQSSRSTFPWLRGGGWTSTSSDSNRPKGKGGFFCKLVKFGWDPARVVRVRLTANATVQCPNLWTLFSRKQAQNARFQSYKMSVLGLFSQKLGL